jgi:hypothetical protein
VDRPGRGRRHVARNSARKRELLEQLFQPGFVLGDIGVDLTPGALQVHVADDRRATVAGSGDVEHIEVVRLDDPVQVHVDEVLPGRRAPMADHQRLHVRERQRLAQQRVVVEVDLADGDVVGGAPVRVHARQQVGRERLVWGQQVILHSSARPNQPAAEVALRGAFHETGVAESGAAAVSCRSTREAPRPTRMALARATSSAGPCAVTRKPSAFTAVS